MRIAEVMAALAAVEAKVPGVVRTYAMPPRGQDAIETPCFWNRQTLRSCKFLPNGRRRREYTLLLSLAVGDASADAEEFANQALAIEDGLIDALQANINLGVAAQAQIGPELRASGENPQPVHWGIDYVGCLYELDVLIDDVGLAGP